MQSATVGVPPKDVPPPTDVVLPDYHPQFGDNHDGVDKHKHPVPAASLVAFLQTLHRPPQVNDAYYRALGVHVHHNVLPEDIVPDPSLLPQSTGWDGITPERAQDANKTFQKPLSNGNKSPDARIYADRRRELSADNQAAFRTLRRIKPQPGKPAARLGGSYEFFKQMDLMAAYWDDTSLPESLRHASHETDEAAHTLTAATAEPERKPQSAGGGEEGGQDEPTAEQVVFRTAPGSQMPASFRLDLVGAFVKLVAYEFGCNLLSSRVEPRLYLRTPGAPQKSGSSPPGTNAGSNKQTESGSDKEIASPNLKRHPRKEPVKSHFSSNCSFLFRMPITRDAARAGIVEGPVAAVSVRNATSFADPLEHRLDLGRELIAALVTAQLRAREGKTEQRLGEGKWWATEKRWGGGQGGPIGREVENDDTAQHRDAGNGGGDDGGGTKQSPSISSLPQTSSSPSTTTKSPHPDRGRPSSSNPNHNNNKRARKGLSTYDNYRMVRKPASNWDKKTRYEAVGSVPGADYDDVFLLSSVFHHFSVLRVRVPLGLLAVFEGDNFATHLAGQQQPGPGSGTQGCGGQRLEVWRSKWYDLFLVDDRLEAMRLLWGVMMWLMRENDKTDRGGATAAAAARSGIADDSNDNARDVVMRDA